MHSCVVGRGKFVLPLSAPGGYGSSDVALHAAGWLPLPFPTQPFKPTVRTNLPELRHEMMEEKARRSTSTTETRNARRAPPPPLSLALACRTPGGKDCIYHLSVLAELSYVEQGSIKLSYTSMKLQNRSELNNKIISFRREAHSIF